MVFLYSLRLGVFSEAGVRFVRRRGVRFSCVPGQPSPMQSHRGESKPPCGSNSC